MPQKQYIIFAKILKRTVVKFTNNPSFIDIEKSEKTNAYDVILQCTKFVLDNAASIDDKPSIWNPSTDLLKLLSIFVRAHKACAGISPKNKHNHRYLAKELEDLRQILSKNMQAQQATLITSSPTTIQVSPVVLPAISNSNSSQFASSFTSTCLPSIHKAIPNPDKSSEAAIKSNSNSSQFASTLTSTHLPNIKKATSISRIKPVTTIMNSEPTYPQFVSHSTSTHLTTSHESSPTSKIRILPTISYKLANHPLDKKSNAISM